MPPFSRTPRILLRAMHVPPRVLYALGLGPLMGRAVLLLTTTGRKSGLPRVTPLQYEEVDGAIYIGAARGTKADWYRNVVAHPRVRVRAGRRDFYGYAETTTDPGRIADFLETRLQRHPTMVGAMLRMEGLTLPPRRADLEAYAAHLALAIIRPEPAPGSGAAARSPS